MNVDPMSWWLVFLHVLHSLPVTIIILIGAQIAMRLIAGFVLI
jgi:hypothetical protein